MTILGITTFQPLAIIQARMASTRLPGKMLLPVGGEPLVLRVWKLTQQVIGPMNVVVATTVDPTNTPLITLLREHDVEVFQWDGQENDVLGRFHACAHHYRWHPDTVILRVTPDDWDKSPRHMLRALRGERFPVEQGGHPFTLAMLDAAQNVAAANPQSWVREREHLDINPYLGHPPLRAAPRADGLPWSIDTPEDYARVCEAIGR